MTTRTVILGGGVGGVVTANTLRGLLPRPHEIVVVERRKSFHLGAAKSWVMWGLKRESEVTRPIEALRARGIAVVFDTVEKIDPARREVKTGGATLTADYLVVALGAELDPRAVPGLERAETFYTLEGAIQLGKAIRAFQGGEAVILNPRLPIKCPPAPYEVAFGLDEQLKNAGLREKTRITFCTVEPAPIPTAGPQVSALLKEELGKRNIVYQPGKQTRAVDAARKVVAFEDGSEVKYDLLITTLPHVAPKVVRDAGLAAEGGWVPVDPRTLRTSADRVWAIGDVAHVPLPGRYKPDVPLALPKAAVFAEAHGRVVAEQIAALAQGQEPTARYDGKGFCLIEFGGEHAMGGEGSFFELPCPKVVTRVPDLEQFEEKLAWAASFLARNF